MSIYDEYDFIGNLKGPKGDKGDKGEAGDGGLTTDAAVAHNLQIASATRAAALGLTSGVVEGRSARDRGISRRAFAGAGSAVAAPRSASGTVLSGVPGVSFGSVSTLAYPADTVRYHPFEVTETVKVTQARFEVTTAPSATCYLTVGIYSVDADWQPMRLIQQDNITVPAVTGTVSVGFTAPVPIGRGRYVVAVSAERAMTLRAYSGGIAFAAATPGNGVTQYLQASATYQTPLPELAPRWTSAPTGAVGGLHSVLLAWTAETPALDALFLLPDRQVVKGANVVLFHQSWDAFWTAWPWDTDIKWQVDAAAAAGANTIRVIGAVGPVIDGAMTSTQYRAKWRQLIDYCASLGMWTYVCGGGTQPDPWYSQAEVSAVLVELGREVNGDPWVIGVDVMQEDYAWAVTNGAAVTAAIRAVCDKPLTFSIPRATPWDANTAFAQNQLRPFIDFIDYHVYYNVAPADVNTFWDLEHESLPLLFGEFGAPLSQGASTQTALYNAVRSVVEVVRPDGRHIAGAVQWAIRDQDTDAASKWGMFAADKTPRTYLIDAFAKLPVRR